MKWINLKTNRCPQCEADLTEQFLNVNTIVCHCGFTIGYTRMKQIIADMVAQDLEYQEKREKLKYITK